MSGMPKSFSPRDHGLRKLRTEIYRGLVFATFSEDVEDLVSYIGPEMIPYIDRIFCKPIVFLGTSRQTSRSNWKIYTDNEIGRAHVRTHVTNAHLVCRLLLE